MSKKKKKKTVTVTALQAEKLLALLETGFSGDQMEAVRLLRQRIADEKAKALASGKIEVEIALTDNSNPRVIGVAVGEHFAVVPPWDAPRCRSRWQVIHRPSGLKAASNIKRKANALQAAKAFGNVALPWGSKDPVNGASAEQIAKLREIAKSAHDPAFVAA